jgi:integrase
VGKCWIFQKPEDVRKLGADKANWYVGFYEPDGHRRKKSFGPGFLGKKKAEKRKHQLEEELSTGTYKIQSRKTWAEFRQEYEAKVLAGKALGTQGVAKSCLDQFERIVKPARMFNFSTATIDGFIAKRRKERGVKRGSVISPATVNRDLRHLKAALRIAKDWGCLAEMPKFRMEKEPGKLPTYVLGDDFARMYGACEHARKPRNIPGVTPADWWRGLLAFGYMSGWRIGDMLALRKDRLDLDAGIAISRHKDNKAKRDDRIKLHQVVIEHLRPLVDAKSPSPLVFPWNYRASSIYADFAKIQEKAGIHLDCDGEHEHSRFCFVYSFHDLRRAFASLNADTLTPDALQKLMRHKSYTTTQRYINLARQMDKAVESLHVPDILKNPSRLKIAGP